MKKQFIIRSVSIEGPTHSKKIHVTFLSESDFQIGDYFDSDVGLIEITKVKVKGDLAKYTAKRLFGTRHEIDPFSFVGKEIKELITDEDRIRKIKQDKTYC